MRPAQADFALDASSPFIKDEDASRQSTGTPAPELAAAAGANKRGNAASGGGGRTLAGNGGGDGNGGDCSKRSRLGEGEPSAAAAPAPPSLAPPAPPPVPPHVAHPELFDVLLGCTKCRYLKRGCGSCRAKPAATRPKSLRWDPDRGRPQASLVPEAPTFYPTEEEFLDPIAYIDSIRQRGGEAAGVACVVPPPSWDPPFALERGTTGQSAESFRFVIRRQLTSSLCKRRPNTDAARGAGNFKYGKRRRTKVVVGEDGSVREVRMDDGDDGGGGSGGKGGEEGEEDGAAAEAASSPAAAASSPAAAASSPAAAASSPAAAASSPAAAASSPAAAAAAAAAASSQPAERSAESDDEQAADGFDAGEFAFRVVDRTHTLRSFHAYADWAKARHFESPRPRGPTKLSESTAYAGVGGRPAAGAAAAGGTWAAGIGRGVGSAGRRGASSAPASAAPPPDDAALLASLPLEPSVEEVEAEFWRVVEDPTEPCPSLYGQDLDSGHHGSGFPLPPLRRRLLAAHLLAKKAAAAAAAKGGGGTSSSSAAAAAVDEFDSLLPAETEREALYARHPWNINNLPRSNGSLLRHAPGDELVTGVMVPWLYVGSALSAFCWHIEDHGLYSVNYLHAGAPKVWYAVPASAAAALEAAVGDALPDLVAAAPNLLYQLVTALSPAELLRRGVPVSRLIHRAGSFAITFPNAYHSGFNTGFNCAEAVNFGPPDWLPAGSSAAEGYRRRGKPATISHDALVVACCRAARACEAARSSGRGAAAEALEREGRERDLAAGAVEARAALERARRAATERRRLAEAAAAEAAAEEESRRQERYERQEARAQEEEAKNSKRREAERRLRAEAEAKNTIAARKSSRASAQSASAAWASIKTVSQRERAAFRAAAGIEAAKASGGGGSRGGDGKRSSASAAAEEPLAPPASPQTPDAAAASSCCAVPAPLRLSAADPPRAEQVPLSGVRLAAGELAVRVDEERRRRNAGLEACRRGSDEPAPAASSSSSSFGQERRMSGKGSGSADPFDGAPADGEDADCEICKCDLWLSAVVAVPSVFPEKGKARQQQQQEGGRGGKGVARGAHGAATAAAAARTRVDRRMVCPEHAPHLGLPPDRLRLLYRHTLPELEGLVSDACAWVPGASEAVAAARARTGASPAERGEAAAVAVGPLSQDTALRHKLEAERAEKRARKKAEAEADAAAASAAARLEEEDGGDFGAPPPAPLPTSPNAPPPGDLFVLSPPPVAWE